MFNLSFSEFLDSPEALQLAEQLKLDGSTDERIEELLLQEYNSKLQAAQDMRFEQIKYEEFVL